MQVLSSRGERKVYPMVGWACKMKDDDCDVIEDPEDVERNRKARDTRTPTNL